MYRGLRWAAVVALVAGGVACDSTVEDGNGSGPTPQPEPDDIQEPEDPEQPEEPEDPEQPEDPEDPEQPEERSCDEPGASRACGEQDGSVEYCDVLNPGEQPQWGPCLAATECEPGDTEECFPGDVDFEGLERSCWLEGGIPMWAEDDCNTPLVLAFEPGPVRMSTAGPASFDISGAGQCVTTDWPAASTPWLAIDRDRSGTIDGGHELFGSGTVLASGVHATHGFAALAELDSDGDGRITPLDERFSELVLWSDYDGDRQSTLWEMEPLSARGVESIELAYESGRDCDARGNCARERSAFTFAAGDGGGAGQVIDLYLACQ